MPNNRGSTVNYINKHGSQESGTSSFSTNCTVYWVSKSYLNVRVPFTGLEFTKARQEEQRKWIREKEKDRPIEKKGNRSFGSNPVWECLKKKSMQMQIMMLFNLSMIVCRGICGLCQNDENSMNTIFRGSTPFFIKVSKQSLSKNSQNLDIFTLTMFS